MAVITTDNTSKQNVSSFECLKSYSGRFLVADHESGHTNCVGQQVFEKNSVKYLKNGIFGLFTAAISFDWYVI